ncbi:MAG TPA: alpha/beta fold hydrolase [Pyrinomonadaceae bacterium]|jgi:pimeloyl-ACP methyl ester carboxylesterase
MEMNYIRRGAGKPLVLIHGIGGSWRSWQMILDDLALERDVIAVDLPGHGDSEPLRGETTIATLADSVAEFLDQNNLTGADVVGSSMGARLVLELARRGDTVGGAVALGPGGFWKGWQIPFFYHSVNLSINLVRALQPVMPPIARSAIGRTLLLSQFSARPWKLPPDLVLDEMRSFAESPVFDELLYNLAYGEEQKAAPRASIKNPLIIGWGRRDRVTLPSQAQRALNLFPDARLHWFERCGHFPQWDKPAETACLILEGTRQKLIAETNGIA